MQGRRPKILVLTQHYRPEPNFITADVAEALAKEAEVVVISAHPNYPLGRFYPGTAYWRPIRTVENGVMVWRLPFLPDHSLSALSRAGSYLSFAVTACILAPFIGGRPDLVWVYHGPFTTGLAALWFRAAFGTRVIITNADVWPESFIAAGVLRAGWLTRAMYAYSRLINRAADVIICSTKSSMARYQRDGVSEAQLQYIPVWVTCPGETRQAGSEDDAGPRRIVYVGNLGPAQALETVLHGAKLLQDRGEPVHFGLYGSGANEVALRRLAGQLRLKNLAFHGRVSPEEAFFVSSSAFAQIVSLRPSVDFRMTVPSKLAFCFAAGAPILYGLEGEAADLARESGGAVPFDPADPVSFAHSVVTLLRAPPQQREQMMLDLRAYYQTHHARATLLEKYKTLLLQTARALGSTAGQSRQLA